MAHSTPRLVLGVAALALAASGLAWSAQGTGKAAAGGTATGDFTVNGKTATLKFAVAKAVEDTFEPGKTGYTLILSDVQGLPGPGGSMDKVTAGTLHYIELNIGHNQRVYGAMLNHEGFKFQQLSAAGGMTLEVETFGPDVLAGKVYIAKPRTSGSNTFQFTATFKAPIEKKK